MVDFLKIATRSTKKGVVEVYPKFIVGKSEDLMIRGSDFYAIWLEDRGLWSTDEQDVIDLVDKELTNFVKENKNKYDDILLVRYMWDSESGIIDLWHKYCQKQMRDNYQPLDDELVFSNQEGHKENYASKRLSYPLEAGDISAWDELVSILYSPEERHKIEWSIGAVVNGASKTLEKFLVFYGAPGTGKSTILKVIEKLFKGYYTVFEAKQLGSASAEFALEAFKSNPLVAIQHDGDLSHIEDNTRLNSLVSHETMQVNEKHKSLYKMKFRTFLFLGTNKPVKITDSKSGIIRRLIDVRPTGDKIPRERYNQLVSEIKNELGAIAMHCKSVFEEDPAYYDEYVPTLMMGESNDFYNFVVDSYAVFKKEDGTTLKQAWEMYKVYCEDAKVPYPLSMRVFKSELMSYFKDFKERVFVGEDWVRSYYSGFKTKIFTKENLEDTNPIVKLSKKEKSKYIEFLEQPSYLDSYCKNCYAQYATSNETPRKKWADVKTKLSQLDTSKLHYVKLDNINHIVIDFDLKDENGNKSFERNLEEASKWPKTYAELSKSGKGIHLHYIYDGDVTMLDRLYAQDIEIKVFNGDSSLRRKLTMCNSDTINHLSDILPKRKEKAMVNFDSLQNERALRTFIVKNLNKEYHPATKPSVDFIYKGLEDAYNSGIKYDVSDMYDDILAFAIHSSHNSDYCMKLVEKMKLRSDEPSDGVDNDDKPIVFYDVEVFPNLFFISWKKEGSKKHNHMFNPSPREIEALFKYRLIGFNCRRYDNHILYARYLGYSNKDLFELSQKIIVSKSKNNSCFFQEAYNISYTDIYDYCEAENKMSLKKWEIKLGIKHQECPLPWDQPVPEKQWNIVAEYCDNDVDAEEAVFNATQEDFMTRLTLVRLANIFCPTTHSCPNDTTNQLTGRIIFRGNKKPQSQFLYTDLSTGVRSDGYVDPCHFEEYLYYYGKSISFLPDKLKYKKLLLSYNETLKEYSKDAIHSKGSFVLKDDKVYYANFKGFDFTSGPFNETDWLFVGELVGEGGYVWADPSMESNAKTLDVASMHPSSIEALKLFGDIYTKNFSELKALRVCVKHSDWESAKLLFDGLLSDFIDEIIAEGATKGLAKSLKTAINSVYGLTSAKFDNICKDPRNIDNIVAKRGALFMCRLKRDLLDMGAKVIHIKTDSIKVVDPSKEIEEYIINKGKEYGYNFELENHFERVCLVNDSVYIAKRATDDPEWLDECEKAKKEGRETPTRWTATGAQFAVPYVFKKCFSHEPIIFDDLCETKKVDTCLYLDMNEGVIDDKLEVYQKLKAAREEKKGIDGKLSLSKPKEKLLEEYQTLTDEELEDKLAHYHEYVFIGKVGLFTPIKQGCGGGLLLRESLKKDGVTGFDSVVGTKGYRWLESETVKEKHLEDSIDYDYYNNLVLAAIETISKFGDYEWFVSDDNVA